MLVGMFKKAIEAAKKKMQAKIKVRHWSEFRKARKQYVGAIKAYRAARKAAIVAKRALDAKVRSVRR